MVLLCFIQLSTHIFQCCSIVSGAISPKSVTLKKMGKGDIFQSPTNQNKEWTVSLTHWGPMTHICISKLVPHWLRLWLVAWLMPSHYLNQCWLIVDWTLGNKFQWNVNQNTIILKIENVFEKVICKMATILSLPQSSKELFYGPPCGLWIDFWFWRPSWISYHMTSAHWYHHIWPEVMWCCHNICLCLTRDELVCHSVTGEAPLDQLLSSVLDCQQQGYAAEPCSILCIWVGSKFHLCSHFLQGPLLLTWFNFNPIMDK